MDGNEYLSTELTQRGWQNQARFRATRVNSEASSYSIDVDFMKRAFILLYSSDAISAGIAFQAENSEFTAALGDNIRPALRLGISMGEVVIAGT